MKIGIILHQKKFFGGGSRLVLELAHALQSRGHAVTLYSFAHVEDNKAAYDTRAKNLRIVTLPPHTNVKRRPLLGFFYIPGTNAIRVHVQENKLAKMLAQQIDSNTDALLPQTSPLDLKTAYFFKRLHKKNIPVIWQMNDIVTHTFAECHKTSWAQNTCSFPEKTWYRFLDTLNVRFLPAADEITVIADIIKELARKHMRKESVTVRVGVNAEQFAYRERRPPQKKVRLLCHAQFYRHRRFEDAIDALALLMSEGMDADLTISGDSETYEAYRLYRDELATQARSLGIADRVHFPGRLPDEAYLDLLHTSDIFLFPHIRQSWGLAPFEAMATGLPVIASNETGASEVLEHEGTALIVPAEKPHAIAAAVSRLVKNPELYKKISKNGATWVRKELTWEHYADALLRLIEKHQK